MLTERSIIDGQGKLLGVDATAYPDSVQSSLLSGAINRSFRQNVNQTRPGFVSMRLSFQSTEDEDVFRRGAITSCYGYNGHNGSYPRLIVAVHDRVLAGRVQGNEIFFEAIMSGLAEGLMHSWMCQADDRLYFQNEVDRPFGWKQGQDAYSIIGDDAMPIGSAMAYGQGRLAVVIGSGVAFSDHIYGNGIRDTRGVEKFSEFQYTNDVGVVGSYSDFGPTNGISIMRQLDTSNGHGPFLVKQQTGFWTFDASGERSAWLYEPRQKKALAGRGCPSPYGFAFANNDLWFFTSDGGITSFGFDRSEEEKSWGDALLSREVSRYLLYTAPENARFVSMSSFGNRLLTTCAIERSESELGGSHRFGNGTVSLDFDRMSRSQGTIQWDGMWTGPRVIQFINFNQDGASRLFAASHDGDGVNRIYAMSDGLGHDEVDSRRRDIVSMYTTPSLLDIDRMGEVPVIKRLDGFFLNYANSEAGARISVKYRPDWHPNLFNMRPEHIVGCRPKDGAPVIYSKFSGMAAFSPDSSDVCRDDGAGDSRCSQHFQFIVRIEGNVSIMNHHAYASRSSDVNPIPCAAVNCAAARDDGENNFEYLLP